MNRSGPAYRLSLSALMAALGAVIMLSSNLIPILSYAAPMLASLALLPVLCEFGKKYAWMTWGITALLALLLCSDREAAFFYLFLGYYPILKPAIDRLPGKALRLIVKLAVFAVAFLILFVLLTFVMGLEDMKSEMVLSIVVYAVLVVAMLFFDRVCERAKLLYELRIRKKLSRYLSDQ